MWQIWYESGGESGEAPPDWLQDLYAIHDDISATTYGAAEYDAAATARDEWIYANVPFFEFVEQPAIGWALDSCLGNVPNDTMFHHGFAPMPRVLFWQPDCERVE